MKYQYFLREDNSPRNIIIPMESEEISRQKELYFSYSYNYEWLGKEKNSLGKYYLNYGEFMELTENEIIIFKDKKMHFFPLKQVKPIEINFRYFIIPLITGGIVTPLSLVAFFNQFLPRWPGIAFIFVGAMLIYYGLKGTYQVAIKTWNDQYAFFVDEKNSELEAFIKKINHLIYRK
ncbi:hypothetical protein [Flexithrix dorotheae]|uniref:hypothetical protein n=1 Tax=Flexithrix dorotheae TaxID=70993 RepID=UPI00038231C7|nr:hypothetical protein [Flexithrix dorotheae]